MADMQQEDRLLLFTPGPLNTARATREAMLQDYGSRDPQFVQMVAYIRTQLLKVAGVTKQDGWECVPMQGSGTFGIESLLGSAVPHSGKLLVLLNGAYGQRMVAIAQALDINHEIYRVPENEVHHPEALEQLLKHEVGITHVVAVHCETTTGILNPIRQLGEVAKRMGRVFLLDSMSAFGGIPVDLRTQPVDALVSSSNKCIEGVPGFSFVLIKRPLLQSCEGVARSLSLDLYAQWAALEATGQFRFTPPTHAMAAFATALQLLAQEGGVDARYNRYLHNASIIHEGMAQMGFQLYLESRYQSPIISTYLYPEDARFDFAVFYEKLAARGLAIYPGKLTDAPCFRIGHIGQLGEPEMQALLQGIRQVLGEMGIALPLAKAEDA